MKENNYFSSYLNLSNNLSLGLLFCYDSVVSIAQNENLIELNNSIKITNKKNELCIINYCTKSY